MLETNGVVLKLKERNIQLLEVLHKQHMFTHTVVVDINTLDKVLLYLEMHLLEQKSEVLLLEKLVEQELKKESSFSLNLKLINKFLEFSINV